MSRNETYYKEMTVNVELRVRVRVNVHHDPGRAPSLNYPGDPPETNVEDFEFEILSDVEKEVNDAVAIEVEEANFDTWNS